jgi:dTDP-4-amino-4,6-dideoxygalactose transaminase
MVNLRDQYLKIKEDIDDAILQTVSSTQFINGPEVKQFEKDFASYLGVKHVISCANGTDALQVAFMSLGLEEGDEIITPSFTYAATAEVLGLLKLTPVFVDVSPHDLNMDISKLEQSITARTKAILPVHLFGGVVDMEALQQVADKYGLLIIEDCAQAVGAEFIYSDGARKRVGSIGTIGTFSFFPSKNLGCYGDGGAVTTNDDALAEKIRMICKHGQKQKYIHDIIGCNSRLDSIQAAVLNVKLKHLSKYNKSRQNTAEIYKKKLAEILGIKLLSNPEYSAHVYHQFTVLADSRDKLQAHLSEHGIGSAIYYPVPLHQQKAFMAIPMRKGDLEVTEEVKDRVISLPIDSELDIEQQEYICKTINDFYTK